MYMPFMRIQNSEGLNVVAQVDKIVGVVPRPFPFLYPFSRIEPLQRPPGFAVYLDGYSDGYLIVNEAEGQRVMDYLADVCR